MRRRFLVIAIMVILGGVFLCGEARAIDLTHSFVVGGDLGFDQNPDLFAWDLLGEYHVTGNVAIGPLLSFGYDANTFLFGASGFAKYKANLSENGKLKPYGLVGIGFLTSQEKKANTWSSDTNFLIPVGGGFEYWVTDRFAWGGDILFNISDDIFLTMFFGVRTRF